MAAALIAQGGGPTPVINASLYGAVMEGWQRGAFTRFLGAQHGLQGILQSRFVDLFAQGLSMLEDIRLAPGAALGSSRVRLSANELDRLLAIFREHDVRYFFYIGGNGSMGTAMDIGVAARSAGYGLGVTGIPKTVDNDLYGTDHTPGYGSAARFYAHAVRDMGMDHRALPSPVLICEIIGRNVGWLVAATAFARHDEDDAPHLIYFPEQPLPRRTLLADIEDAYRRWGRVFVCICEGQLDENGEPFGADVDRPDNPQHRLASNLGHAVARFVSRELNLRTRSERPSLLARSCSTLVSETDRAEAELVGRAAVRAALAGNTGLMIALRRGDGPEYGCETILAPFEEVARKERQLPAEFMDAGKRFVTEGYLRYAKPLVGPVARHARF
jgi:ATP-dependent phosphofructokinase / diphosphate-dependent phosphofructokinase